MNTLWGSKRYAGIGQFFLVRDTPTLQASGSVVSAHWMTVVPPPHPMAAENAFADC